ncbi:hypothetical protein OHS58_35015 [Amycolatopsis sp. NBC_00348]|uniref:hypothetical protein n=1 Tax=Amycolatopsis sp. NBC_00348 TaxID=2975956 RepID=UPI002E274233
MAEPAPGWFLVELFSWVMGESSDQQLVPIDQMAGWRFYDDATWMGNSIDLVRERWKRELVEADE